MPVALNSATCLQSLFAYDDFSPTFFRKTNAEKRLRNNLGIHVNIRSVETHPKVGPFSGRNVFVSNLQRAGEALTQSFGGGSRLYIYPRGS